MILATDVQYCGDTAVVAGVAFVDWQSESSTREYLSIVENVAAYEPGSFYKRELPCLLRLLEEHKIAPDIIVVDGYVYLDGVAKSGLGKHLFDVLKEEVEVIGVAKKSFMGISHEHEIYRGKSRKPLFVTSTASLKEAKNSILNMHGVHRIPTLLKRVDQLCREKAKEIENSKV
ncbi:endonuclease V [Pleionea sediminis]|uniref:endonuclease V n=1 Tax=Pleionea sediminis TaxID=2569479 RepID=UPI0011862895|nr:endonuclease V [Pleionea sediminis]